MLLLAHILVLANVLSKESLQTEKVAKMSKDESIKILWSECKCQSHCDLMYVPFL